MHVQRTGQDHVRLGAETRHFCEPVGQVVELRRYKLGILKPQRQNLCWHHNSTPNVTLGAGGPIANAQLQSWLEDPFCNHHRDWL